MEEAPAAAAQIGRCAFLRSLWLGGYVRARPGGCWAILRGGLDAIGLGASGEAARLP